MYVPVMTDDIGLKKLSRMLMILHIWTVLKKSLQKMAFDKNGEKFVNFDNFHLLVIGGILFPYRVCHKGNGV